MKNSRWLMISTVILTVLAFGFGAGADTFWTADVSAGALWSDAGSWSAGLPDTADRANFTNTQDTEWGVDVDTAAVMKKILVSQDYIFNGAGSIELQPASSVHWDKVIEVNQTGLSPEFNTDVTIHQTTDYVPRISVYPSSTITFNGALTLTNSANSTRQTDFYAAAATGTIVMNGDIYNHCGMRFGNGNLTTIIGGSGTTYGRADSGAAVLLSGRVELNRASALINTSVKMEGATLVIGADHALVSGADLDFRTGTVLADGYDQDFGTLDLSLADVTLDMNDTASVFTFEDSSAVSWGTAGLSINNAGGATVRFPINGLTSTQITQITVDGTTLTSGDTVVEGGYLYVVKPVIATGDTFWESDVAAGSTWSVSDNWTAGRPSTAGRANFVNTQATTYDVDVNMASVLKKILISTNYMFNGTGSIELQPASTAHWDPAIEVNQSFATTVFNADVTVVGTTDYVMDLRNKGMLTFNGTLTLTNTAYSRPINFNDSGTTVINGDFYNYCGLRMGAAGTTVRIGGNGTTVGSGALTLGSGRVELNRAAAVINSAISLTGSTVSLGADGAIGTAANLTLNSGGLEAEGYDQEFGWLNVGSGDILVDMDSSDSVWTFADSSAQGWGSGGIAITNVGDSAIRFEQDGGSGLTETQMGQISIDGQTLTSGDTRVEDGYLYITPSQSATALYNDWADGYELSSPDSDLLSDPDFDGMNNLIEYALGGNPTHSNAATVLPVGSLTDDGATLEMVYLRRLDAAERGLTYEVLRDGSLLSGTWAGTGIAETSGAVDADFESVTNSISTETEDTQFLKLHVEFE